MSGHVVVIDSTARRAQIKTTPNKPLADVLGEACAKLGINASQYGLKNNNKPVDLSRTIRLSGLPNGAKLELVQLSKSAGVVSLALQLPESEARGQPNARLTDKFPSSTTLWLVLRKFEAGVAGSGAGRNFTARGVPSATTGQGRLFYEQPVLQVMNRELSSFTDLQKSLAQLGFNSGSALLRLSFRTTDTPLEEAMAQIQGYFDSVEPGPAPPALESREAPSSQPQPQEEEEEQEKEPYPPPEAQVPPATAEASDSIMSEPPPAETPEPTATTASGRRVSVYNPPSSSTPSAALLSHSESDFVPTVEHAKAHQKLLEESSRNRRLLTDKELEAQQAEETAKLAAIKEVEIKVRFPDQSTVVAKFGQQDAAQDLYSFVRECLEGKFRAEAFLLRVPGAKGKNEVIVENARKIIKDLQLKGRVLVVFGWDDTKASTEARSSKAILKPELRAQAQEIKVQEVPKMREQDDDPGVAVSLGKSSEAPKEDGLGKKLPKWLKGLSKK